MGDSVALPALGPAVAVVEAAVAPGRAALVSNESARPGSGQAAEGALAVAPARAVVVSANEAVPAPEAAPSPGSPGLESPSAATPAPELASAPVSPPSTAPEGKAPGGPITAGGPGPVDEGGEVCEGDEYLLTITLLEGEAVTVLLERIGADGSSDTLEFDGSLEDARSLVLHLTSEGGCVEVEVVPPPDEEAVEESTSTSDSPPLHLP